MQSVLKERAWKINNTITKTNPLHFFFGKPWNQIQHLTRRYKSHASKQITISWTSYTQLAVLFCFFSPPKYSTVSAHVPKPRTHSEITIKWIVLGSAFQHCCPIPTWNWLPSEITWSHCRYTCSSKKPRVSSRTYPNNPESWRPGQLSGTKVWWIKYPNFFEHPVKRVLNPSQRQHARKPSTKSQCLTKEGIGQRSNKELKSHSERAGEIRNSFERSCSQSIHNQDNPKSFAINF